MRTPPVRIFFRLAFALTWGIGGIGLLSGALFTASPFYYLAGYSVSFAGIALTAYYEGRAGLLRLGRRLIPRHSDGLWCLLVIGGYTAAAGISIRIAGMVVNLPLFLSGLPPALARDTGPLGEEFGRRGFALPRVLERHSPLNASLILGAIHALWHVPLFFIPGMPQNQLSFPLFELGAISIAIFDTALYLRTCGNLFLAILVHATANLCGLLLGPRGFPFLAAAEALAARVIVLGGGLTRRISKARD